MYLHNKYNNIEHLYPSLQLSTLMGYPRIFVPPVLEQNSAIAGLFSFI